MRIHELTNEEINNLNKCNEITAWLSLVILSSFVLLGCFLLVNIFS